MKEGYNSTGEVTLQFSTKNTVLCRVSSVSLVVHECLQLLLQLVVLLVRGRASDGAQEGLKIPRQLPCILNALAAPSKMLGVVPRRLLDVSLVRRVQLGSQLLRRAAVNHRLQEGVPALVERRRHQRLGQGANWGAGVVPHAPTRIRHVLAHDEAVTHLVAVVAVAARAQVAVGAVRLPALHLQLGGAVVVQATPRRHGRRLGRPVPLRRAEATANALHSDGVPCGARRQRRVGDALLSAPGPPGNLVAAALVEAVGCAREAHAGGLLAPIGELARGKQAAPRALLARVDKVADSRLQLLGRRVPAPVVAVDAALTGLRRAQTGLVERRLHEPADSVGCRHD